MTVVLNLKRPPDRVHIWLPFPDAVKRLGGLPDGLTASIWDGSDAFPPDAHHVKALFVPMIEGETERLRSVVATMPRLKFVQSPYADVAWILPAIPTNVDLADTGDSHVGAVVEWVVAAAFRHLHGDFPPTPRPGVDNGRPGLLRTQRIAVLGKGAFGECLTTVLSTFGTSVSVFGATEHGGRSTVEFANAVADTDVLVVAPSRHPFKAGFVDHDVLASLPDHALIINAGDGAVVDTDALARELTGGRLFAILDATHPRTLPADHPLLASPRCAISANVASFTTRYFDDLVPLIMSQLQRIAHGRSPRNLVRRSDRSES